MTETNPKAGEERITSKGIIIKHKILKSEDNGNIYKVLEINCQLRILYPVTIPFKNKNEFFLMCRQTKAEIIYHQKTHTKGNTKAYSSGRKEINSR